MKETLRCLWGSLPLPSPMLHVLEGMKRSEMRSATIYERRKGSSLAVPHPLQQHAGSPLLGLP